MKKKISVLSVVLLPIKENIQVSYRELGDYALVKVAELATYRAIKRSLLNVADELEANPQLNASTYIRRVIELLEKKYEQT